MGGMIHIIDDEEPIRDALIFLFASRGLHAQGWPSGEEFLAALPLEDCACLILDVRMGDLSGPEVFERLRAQGSQVSVIFLTGHADVPVAVQTLKAGAFDFLEKPFNDNQIVDLALRAIETFEISAADTLNIAMRTVEAHRGRILNKMGARNGIELAVMLRDDES